MNRPAFLAALLKTLGLCALSLMAIGLSETLASAGVNRWTTSGPFGVPISSLAIDPTNPETVYAGTGKEVFKSRNGGLSWTTSFEAPSGLPVFFSGLAIDPLFSSNVYAAMNLGVFKSLDAGGSWAAIGPPVSDPVAYSVSVDPVSPSKIVAGTASGLFRSDDRGSSWSGRLLATSIYSLVFSPQTPSTIFAADIDYSFYAAFYPTTLFTSRDGGASWTPSATGIHISPGALTIDPTNPSTLYAGNARGGGVYKSVDSGSTWHQASTNLGPVPVSAVVIDPRNPGTLYAAVGDGVSRSRDGGVTWKSFNVGMPPLEPVASLAIDRTGTRLYAGSFIGGVFSYQIVPSGALDLSVGTDNEARLLFSSDNRVVFRSFDNSGRSTSTSRYGPYIGWTAVAIADGSDGLTRVLWNHLDGSAALWLLGRAGNLASYGFRPGAGWTAADVSVGTDGTAYLLWTNADGRTEITSVAVSGAQVGRATHGPFPGWLARSISTGTDGLTRLLWSHTDGRVGVSLIDSGRIVVTHRFAPAAGWTAQDVAVGNDNRARILFVNAEGRMVLWSMDDSGAVTNSESVYGPPVTGQRATRISAGADGLTRVLWTGPDGAGTVWLMSLDNVRESSFGFDPDPCAGCWDY